MSKRLGPDIVSTVLAEAQAYALPRQLHMMNGKYLLLYNHNLCSPCLTVDGCVIARHSRTCWNNLCLFTDLNVEVCHWMPSNQQPLLEMTGADGI